MKYAMYAIVGVIVISGTGLILLGGKGAAPASGTPIETPTENTMPVPGADTPEMVVENETSGDTESPDAPASASSVKEFTMTAYYDDAGIWYSLKEIAVKKGDTVRLKVTNTKGMHDVTIDEYGIKKELPLNEEVTVEFVADKAGTFVYYCSKPNHRDRGQWGTLRVTE